MTTPRDPRDGGRYSGPYGPPPSTQPSRQGRPAPTGGYDPYGPPRAPRQRSSPFAPPEPARRRPPLLGLAVGLLVLGALPWLLAGIAFAVLPLNVQAAIDDGTFANSPLAGRTAADLQTLLRVAAGVAAVFAIVHIALAVLTYGRRGWARLAVVSLTAVFAAALVVVLVSTGSLVVVVLIAVPVAGAVLLFLGPVPAWFAGARRGL